MAVVPRRSHPAPFPRYVLNRIELHLSAERRRVGHILQVLDPFAGIGRIHDLPSRLAETTGVELEPEWAACRAGTIVGDATQLPAKWSGRFDVVVTSPCYANRLADHHEARDSCAGCGGAGSLAIEDGCSEAPWCCPACERVDCTCGVLAKAMREHNHACPTCRSHRCTSCNGSGLSKRYTYRHALGRMPSEGSAATLQWSKQGGKYRALHGRALDEMHRVLVEDGLVIVNVKNHLDGGAEQYVAEWWRKRMREAGFVGVVVDELAAPGIRHGANAQLRVTNERLLIGRKWTP